MRRKHWLAVVALVVICVVAGMLLMRPSQPGLVYKGKTVEEWGVELYLARDESARNAASVALKELGPKAVPDIIRMLRLSLQEGRGCGGYASVIVGSRFFSKVVALIGFCIRSRWIRFHIGLLQSQPFSTAPLEWIASPQTRAFHSAVLSPTA